MTSESPPHSHVVESSLVDTATENVRDCDLCHGTGTRLWETYERYGFVFNLVECRDCGLAYVTPRPTADSIGGFYDAQYSCAHGEYVEPRWMKPIVGVIRPLLAARYSSSVPLRGFARSVIPWERKWRMILQANHMQAVSRIGSVLDVGCGRGYWLNTMRRWGFDCVGCEPDSDAARAAAASGLEVVQSDLFGAGFSSETFDVVRFSHVLEHVHSPTSVLDEAVRVVRPGGLVIAIVPNHSGMILQSFRLIEDVPRHLFSFAPETMRRYFDKAGLEVISLETVTDFAYSIYGQFHPPVAAVLRAAGAGEETIASVGSFFSYKNRSRDREYAATAAFADSLGLGATVVAVGRRSG